jgi:hypothetical protein
MHDRLSDDQRESIDDMSEAEKLELIARVTRSLGHEAGSADEAIGRQRSTFLRLQQDLAKHRHDPDPFAHLGYSDAAHDAIIYNQGHL